jgi:uncharacterized protein (TIGR00369 family)
MRDTVMTRDDLQAFLTTDFPQVAGDFVIDAVAPMRLTVRRPVSDSHLRPGGTISGPTMFALADVGMYLAILAMIGPQALAVTTSCAIDFMRKPAQGHDLLAAVRLLKLGRTLAVGDVLIHSDADLTAPVARASLTYSLPNT